MIEFQKISKRYGSLQVLKEVDLRIEPGRCAVLIGANGCGKTTLLKCMMNLVMPDSGTVTIAGEDIRGGYEYRRRIGFMPQIGSFPENLRVEEVVEAVLSIRRPNATRQSDREPDREPDRELYHRFDIPALGRKKMKTLSGGMVQKVSAALAFLFDPDIVVMDEPFAGLDLLAADLLRRKIVAEKEKGKTILLTSHTFGEIDGVVSDVVFMSSGRVLFHKPLADLLAETRKNNVTEAVISLLQTV